MEHLTDALVIAAHPDDAEIGVGGTLALFHAAGKKTAIIDLTDGEPTPYGSVEIRATESASASKILGITQRINLGLKNRELEDSVDARKKLASAIRTLKPHTLFLPYEEDAHPDHMAAFDLSVAARFYSKFVKSDLQGDPWSPKQVFFYYACHLRTKVQPTFVVAIDSVFETKMKAIRAYESQFVAHAKNQGVLEDIRAEARYWGSRVYAQFGEPFIAREHIGIRSVSSLLEL